MNVNSGKEPELEVDGVELYAIPGADTYFISECAKVWREAISRTFKAGAVRIYPGRWLTQRIDDKGYLVVDINITRNTPTAVHLLLARTFLGWEPGWETDHEDQNKLNNSLDNLRVVELRLNRYNNKAKGYSWHPEGRKWCARILVKTRMVHLGLFNTEEEAHAAYLAAKAQITPHLIIKSA